MSRSRDTAVMQPPYLQLWFELTWTDPAVPVEVTCQDCPWYGRRRRPRVSARPCPRCGGLVRRQPHVRVVERLAAEHRYGVPPVPSRAGQRLAAVR